MGTLRIVMSERERRFELEGEQEIVLDCLSEMRTWLSESLAEDLPEPEAAAVSNEKMTLRAFVTAKQHGNAYEAIAVVLAYKKAYENRPDLSADEIRTSLIQAGVRPPGVIGQALADCRRRYGYIEVGSQRGLWRLSPQGETLIEIDLPRTRN